MAKWLICSEAKNFRVIKIPETPPTTDNNKNESKEKNGAA